MRCFFALDLPEPVRAVLAAAAAELGRVSRSVRPTAADQLHVTLKFLGEVEQEQAAALAARLRALALPSLRLQIDRLGRFPPHGPPRVLWAGLGGDVEPLAKVAAQLEEAAERIGIARDERAFHPHVTLARVKWPDRTRELLQRLDDLAAGARTLPFLAPAVTLYRSELGPDRSRYSVLERVEPAPA